MGVNYSVVFGARGSVSRLKETFDRFRGSGGVLFEKEHMVLTGERRKDENIPTYVYVVLIVVMLFFLAGGIIIGVVPAILLYRYMIYRLPKESHEIVIPISSVKNLIMKSDYYLFQGTKTYVTILFTLHGEDNEYEKKINFSFFKKSPHSSELTNILESIKNSIK